MKGGESGTLEEERVVEDTLTTVLHGLLELPGVADEEGLLETLKNISGLRSQDVVELVVGQDACVDVFTVEVVVHNEGPLEVAMEAESGSCKRAAALSNSDDVLTPVQRPGKKVWAEVAWGGPQGPSGG
nr:uncharacterized protein LOC128699738 [Cherax quadricarinatus]